MLEKRRYKPYGGAERATHAILALLAEEGFEITVVTGTRGSKAKKGVKFIYSKLFDVPSKVHLWVNLLKSIPNWLNNLIKESDVVYVPRLAYPVIPLAEKYGKKVVVHLHDYQPITYCAAILHNQFESYNAGLFRDIKRSLKFEILENESVWRATLSSLATPFNVLTKLWVGEADEIICVSKRQHDIIAQVAPQLADRLKVIYNPMPTVPLVEKKLGNPNFVYLGGDSNAKGFFLLLEASRRIFERNQNVKFLLTKNFRDVNKFLVETLDEKSKGKYSLLGHLSYEKVMKLHSISHAILFLSIWEEPLPYVVLEALLAGTIPIASRVGGVPEMVKGSFAQEMLFEPCNVEELADRMKSLLAMSNEQITDVGCSLREAVLRNFDSDVTKKKLIDTLLP